MAEIFQFRPKAELDAEQNLAEFVRRCRDDLTVFGADLDWQSVNWKGVCNFTRIGAPSRGFKPDQVLESTFQPFAKAYMRYQQGHKPTKTRNEMTAIRCIEPALIKVTGRADITLVDILVLDEAAIIAKNGYSEGAAYQAGSELQRLATFLTKNGLVSQPLLWKSPIPKGSQLNRTDKKTKEKRAKKMPEAHILDSMAEMFSNDLQAVRDKYAVSTFGLLMCAPSRISEVEDLPVNCLHYDKDRKGVERVAFRFYAGKGFGGQPKWIPSCFVEIAEVAVQRITELTEPGRKLAKWLEEKPNQFYRHEHCPDLDEDAPLTAEQICMAMGWDAEGKSAHSVAFHPSRTFTREVLEEKGYVTLRDLNRHVHNTLPTDWPWKNKERGIKYSNALYCMRKNELHADKGTSPVLPWVPGKSQFTNDLTARKGVVWTSVWDRHGYTNPDGSRITMNSHKVRHYLNTAAQRGELGQLDVAFWSGRANIHQNKTYNHMGDHEILDKVKGTGLIAKMGGALGKVRSNLPVSLEDLNEIGDCVAHVTEYGFCVHDWSMVPCQKHRDCLNCTEQVCVKGDEEKLKRLKDLRERIVQQLSKAEAAKKDGIYGADRWAQHQKRTLHRANQIIEIQESKEVADGALIKLRNDQEFSPLKREIAARSAAPKLENSTSDKRPDMDQLRALMGGAFG